MKDYLLTIKNTEDSFIVSAKDTKDAIQTLWEKITAEDFPMSINKTDLQARSLGSLHTEHGKILPLGSGSIAKTIINQYGPRNYITIDKKHTLHLHDTLWELDTYSFDIPRVVECWLTQIGQEPDGTYLTIVEKDDASHDNTCELCEINRRLFYTEAEAEIARELWMEEHNVFPHDTWGM